MTTPNEKQMRHYEIAMERVKDCSAKIIDAIRNDLADNAHKDELGNSNVVMWRICPAADCFTRDFNFLIDGLEDAIKESERMWDKIEWTENE